ncbi:MAG: vWA domain-containing protein [Gemmataceae bacterium]
MDKVEIAKAPELLWRRSFEPMADWVIFVPLLFALGVVALLFLYRKENRGLFLMIAGGALAVFAAVYLPLAFMLKERFTWIVVVVPTVAIALVYVGFMYVKDARSIHPVWAGFLGLLRCLVYGILAVVFFLPGCQSFETAKTPSKIILAFDVSRSMDSQDRQPDPDLRDKGAVPSRKQEVIALLKKPLGVKGREKASALELIADKTPMTIYRFGGRVDEKAVVHFKNAAELAAFNWDDWLNPDPAKVPDAKVEFKETMTKDEKENALKKAQEEVAVRRGELDQVLNGTNIYGALDRISKLEAGNYVQAFIVFSDGHSNSGSEEALREFYARVEKPSPPINVFTVGVGEDRKKVKIEIQDLLVPAELRPEDKFPIRILATGENLQDVETGVRVELTRIKDKDGRAVTDKIYTLPAKTDKFKGGGDFPRVQFEYDELDLRKMAGIKGTDETATEPIMGTWKITARMPKHPKEHLKEKEHEQTVEFQVYGKKLRVLVASSGPLRDYQFVRTLFYRESLEKRLEFCVYLQNAAGTDNIDQDVDPERFLSKFPDRLGAPTKDDPFGTFNAFDVVLAFDLDWRALAPSQLKLLKQWVGSEGGGLVFVAGPMNTYQMSLKDGDDALGILSLKTLCPVGVQDNRLLGVLEKGLDINRPHIIRFTDEAKKGSDFEFLRLDDEKPGTTAGWDFFFYGDDGKDALKRGFHWYYPVESLKPASKVLATFDSPAEAKIKSNEPGGDKMIDQPYIVTMKYGNGKTVWIGSAETWRMRAAKEIFQDRFWVKLSRYTSSGITQNKRYGRILMATKATAGKVYLEAEIKGEDMLPLKKPVAKLEVRRIDRFGGDARPLAFELKAKDLKRTELAGWYDGTVELADEGEYLIKIPVTGTDAITHIVKVKRPNIETDNVRTNFPALFKIATEAHHVLNGLEGETYSRVKARFKGEGAGTKGSASERLFLPLSGADILPECIRVVPPRETTVKGAIQDLWDGGWKSGLEVDSFWLAVFLPLGVGLLGLAILCFTGAWVGGLIFAGAFAFVSLVVCFVYLIADIAWPMLDVNVSFVLITVVGLLAIEWLTRKLLRLA